MPTVTVAMMMPIPEALHYVLRKQGNLFHKDEDMQLRGQVDNNVRLYFMPIAAVYPGWQTLNFWVLKIEEGKVNSLSVKVMKFILLVTNGKYREREVASSLLFVHTEISSMERIASGFVNLLENAITNLVVMLIVQSNCNMLNFVYDRGKLCEILFDAGNHKLEVITQSLKIFMQWLLIGFMSQTQIYHHHRNYDKEIEKVWWSSKILVQLVFNFSSVNRLVPSWFLRKLMSLPTMGKKVIWLLKSVNEVRWRMALNFSWIAQFVFDRGKVLKEANFNLEDKVVLKGWVLIGTRI
jgi:hypothetical protein